MGPKSRRRRVKFGYLYHPRAIVSHLQLDPGIIHAIDVEVILLAAVVTLQHFLKDGLSFWLVRPYPYSKSCVDSLSGSDRLVAYPGAIKTVEQAGWCRIGVQYGRGADHNHTVPLLD